MRSLVEVVSITTVHAPHVGFGQNPTWPVVRAGQVVRGKEGAGGFGQTGIRGKPHENLPHPCQLLARIGRQRLRDLAAEVVETCQVGFGFRRVKAIIGGGDELVRPCPQSLGYFDDKIRKNIGHGCSDGVEQDGDGDGATTTPRQAHLLGLVNHGPVGLLNEKRP